MRHFWPFVRPTLALLCCMLMAGCGGAGGGGNTATVSAAPSGSAGILLLGDSITFSWEREGRHALKNTLDPYRPVVYGIQGAGPAQIGQHIVDGRLDKLKTSTIVLLAGTNMLASPPSQIARANQDVIAKIHQKWPGSKVLLLGILPRGHDERSPYRGLVSRANQELAKLENGSTIHFLDAGAQFLDARGALSAKHMPDEVHLSQQAYQLLANALVPALEKMRATPVAH